MAVPKNTTIKPVFCIDFVVCIHRFYQVFNVTPTLNSQSCIYSRLNEKFKQVLVSSIGKVSDGWKKDLRFNPRLHQKLIGVLVWW